MNRGRMILCAAIVAGASTAATAQPTAVPAASVYAIRNARINTLAGAAIEAGTVVVRDGRIAAVGANVSVPADAKVIDGTGLTISPGFFDAMSQLGLTEVGAVNATNDYAETGEFNPQL